MGQIGIEIKIEIYCQTGHKGIEIEIEILLDIRETGRDT